MNESNRNEWQLSVWTHKTGDWRPLVEVAAHVDTDQSIIMMTSITVPGACHNSNISLTCNELERLGDQTFHRDGFSDSIFG